MRRALKVISAIYLGFLAIYLLLRFTLGDSLWWISLLNTFALLLFIPLPLVLLVIVLQKTLWLRLLGVGVTIAALGWFGPYFFPKPTPTASGKTIRILTFNMQSKSEGLEQRLRTTPIDLVFLQEIPVEYKQTILSLINLYPHQFTQKDQWGNAVLSSYPILKAENLTGFEPSIPQRLELDISGTTIAIYNMHPTWPIGNPRVNLNFLPGFILKGISGFDDTLRNRQILLLIQYLKSESLPYIVAGDFNLSQYTATYDQLARVAKDSFREAETGFGNTWPATLQSGLSLPPLLKLDYVWHSEHFRAQNVEVQAKLNSDHFPVSADLILLSP